MWVMHMCDVIYMYWCIKCINMCKLNNSTKNLFINGLQLNNDPLVGYIIICNNKYIYKCITN